MKIHYDSRFVPAHNKDSEASVLLINEAPGPDEAKSGIPLFGRQGANLFHALRNSGIEWAVNHEKFIWPIKSENDKVRHYQKIKFLDTRSEFITCTNSYPYWPKPKLSNNKTMPSQPLKKDILSEENILRIKSDILPSHSALLICGECAYTACIGEDIFEPAKHEFAELEHEKIILLNTRLNSNFKRVWYMGHTRRWSFNTTEVKKCLLELAKYLNWKVIN